MLNTDLLISVLVVISSDGRQLKHFSQTKTKFHRNSAANYITKIVYGTRCYFSVRSKADTSQLNLPHGTNN